MDFAGHQINLDKPAKKEVQWVRRHSAMVFQNYSLFKNKTALQNITEGLIYAQGMTKNQANAIAEQELASLGLSQQFQLYPAQLSGGQQQRIGIARATVLNPEIILFDEPTSALDPELVGSVLGDMRKLAEAGQTMIIVTHQLGFARQVADRIVFFDEGKIIEEGAPQELFDHPQNKRTAQFLTALSNAN